MLAAKRWSAAPYLSFTFVGRVVAAFRFHPSGFDLPGGRHERADAIFQKLPDLFGFIVGGLV